MKRVLAVILLPAALAAGGCAGQASMDARYDASLQRWQGATRAELEAAWGRPTQVATAGGDILLTWVVRSDIDSRPRPDGVPVVVVSRGGAASPEVRTVVPGAPAPAVVPITCTTRFVLKDGRVASWKFEGLGCGAPY
jgi:hypothetical protein